VTVTVCKVYEIYSKYAFFIVDCVLCFRVARAASDTYTKHNSASLVEEFKSCYFLRLGLFVETCVNIYLRNELPLLDRLAFGRSEVREQTPSVFHLEV
jgi:hypothetical protein